MRLPCIAIGVFAALLSPGLAQTPAAEPWIGTWLLDTSSTAPAQYRRVTLRLEAGEGDGLKVIYAMVGTRGGVTHMEWTGKFDGRDYPVQGLDYVMTNAYTRRDARSYSIHVKVDGVSRATTSVSISPDGSTMTAVTTDALSDNAPSTAIYRRKK